MLYLVSQSSIYQFLPLDRFINSKDRKTTSGCNTFCRSQNSEMVDAEMIMKNKGLFQTHLLKLCPKVGHSCNLHVDVRYNFSKEIWINGLGKSQFDDDLWFNLALKKENYIRVYPVVSNTLSIL